MEILIILTVGTLCIVCFLIGVYVGEKVVKGESVEYSSLNPVRSIKESQEKKQAVKEAKEEAEKQAILMHNIEIYDGTSIGQKDVN